MGSRVNIAHTGAVAVAISSRVACGKMSFKLCVPQAAAISAIGAATAHAITSLLWAGRNKQIRKVAKFYLNLKRLLSLDDICVQAACEEITTPAASAWPMLARY